MLTKHPRTLPVSSEPPVSLQATGGSPGPLLAGTDGLGERREEEDKSFGYLGGGAVEGAFL